MRSLLILAPFALLGCSTAIHSPRESAESEQRLQQALAGKVAGKPESCLSSLRSNDMIRIDDNTILFRQGSKRVYRNELTGSCNGLANPSSTLVTNSLGGGGQLCRGDIAQVVDSSTGMFRGSCALGDFVPYTAPRG